MHATIRRALPALALIAWAAGPAAAQQGAEVELGFGGAVVAEAWNPVRVVSRQVSAAVLEVTADLGSLREGSIPYTYRVEIPGGSGLVSFTDDLYLPAWRNLQWRLSTESRVLASGALGPRDVDTRLVHVLVSREPGTWRSAYPDDARLLERNGPDLPARTAAYDGVATLLVDGTTAPPRPEALIAAATEGVRVVLVGDLPSSFDAVARLGSTSGVRYGNGSVVLADRGSAATALSAGRTIADAGIAEAAAGALEVAPPPAPATGTILLAGAAYAVAVLLALRFGGLPGILASLALAAVASVAAWSAFRVEQSTFAERVQIEIGAGGIARSETFTRVLTLPAAEIDVGERNRPLERVRARAAPHRLTLPLPRWGQAGAASAPITVTQQFLWDGGDLVNRTGVRLDDVWVVGLGPQAALGASSTITPVSSEDERPDLLYGALFEHLPAGTALARVGDRVLIAVAEGGA